MKKLLFSFFFLLIVTCSFAQHDSLPGLPDSTKAPLLFADVMPEYPGGPQALSRFLRDNIRYPQAEKDNGIQGVVWIRFVVDTDGTVTNIQAAKEVAGGPGLTREAMRVVALLPQWKPGMINGRPVRVMMQQPFRFVLDGGYQVKRQPLTFGPQKEFFSPESFYSPQMPRFPGGDTALQQYVAQHFNCDYSRLSPYHSDYIEVDMVIDTSGRIWNLALSNKYSFTPNAADSAALKLLSEMPAWQAGQKDGRKCNVLLRLLFVLPGKDSPNTSPYPICRIIIPQETHSMSYARCGLQYDTDSLRPVAVEYVKKLYYPGGWPAAEAVVDSLVAQEVRKTGYACDGLIIVSFIVDKEGRVINVHLSSGFSEPFGDFNMAAVDAVCRFGKWHPGRKGLRRRNTFVTMTVNPAHCF